MWLEQSNKFAVPAKRSSSNHEYGDQEAAQRIKRGDYLAELENLHNIGSDP